MANEKQYGPLTGSPGGSGSYAEVARIYPSEGSEIVSVTLAPGGATTLTDVKVQYQSTSDSTVLLDWVENGDFTLTSGKVANSDKLYSATAGVQTVASGSTAGFVLKTLGAFAFVISAKSGPGGSVTIAGKA